MKKFVSSLQLIALNLPLMYHSAYPMDGNESPMQFNQLFKEFNELGLRRMLPLEISYVNLRGG